jgi:hypothetical protein
MLCFNLQNDFWVFILVFNANISAAFLNQGFFFVLK